MKITHSITLILLITASLLGGYFIYTNNTYVDSSFSTKQIEKEFNTAYEKDITTSGTIVEYTLTAAPTEIELFPGEKTVVWAYNGQIPGPELRIKKGDTLRVNFTNKLPQETTIHWHGVRVPNAMDGVPGVTQDPIKPGDSFVYEFTPKDAGTFWFHPHVRTSEQIEKGLFGTLIVEDQNSDEYSQDVSWVLDDWLITNNGQIYPEFNTPHDLMHDGRWGNVVTVNGNTNEVLEVHPGERIRLRLVNVANGRVFTPQFQNLNPLIIAVDGMRAAEQVPLDNFELAPGNRLDLDITIPQEYKNRTLSVTDTFTKKKHLTCVNTVR